MRVLHVIPDINRESGGPSRSSQGLVAALAEAGCEVRLLSMEPGNMPWLLGENLFFCAKGKGYRAYREAMQNAIGDFRPELIHIHAIWKLPCHIAATCAREAHIPYVIAPRGMLEPWSLEQKKWKKTLAMNLYQRKDLKGAIALHATAASEAAHFRELGFLNQVIVSPNGVNVPNTMPKVEKTENRRARALFMSRIHPKKGLLELLEAWKQSAPPNWDLEIAGTDADGYLATVKAFADKLKLRNSVFFSGAHKDEEKWEVYQHASLFILPSYSENFGIVIAEALYAGLPVITTNATPWQELASQNCGWWTETGSAACSSALKEAFALSSIQLAEMGLRGRRLIEEKYSWQAIARKLQQEYSRLTACAREPLFSPSKR